MASNFNLNGAIKLGALASAPSIAVAGVVYYNTTDNKLYYHDGTGWQEVASAGDISGFLKADGSIPLSGNLLPDADLSRDLGSSTSRYNHVYTDRVTADRVVGVNRLQGGFADTGPTPDLDIRTNDSDEADQGSGSITIQTGPSVDGNGDAGEGTGSTGDINIRTGDTQGTRGNIYLTGESILMQGSVDMGGNSLSSLLPPTNDTDAATKKYVDDSIAALPDPIVYSGTWNASTNTPALSNSDVGVTGHLYRVTVAGTHDFGAGPISFDVGDSVVNNGSVWEKWDHSDQVISVNGQTGAVVLGLNDLDDVSTPAPTNGQVLTYNSGAGQWEASNAAAGYTDEEAQDAVGNILDDGTVGDIIFNYDDATPLISAEIKDASVTDTKLADDAVTPAKIAENPTLRGAVYRAADLVGGNAVLESYIDSIALAASQSNVTIPVLSFPHASYEGCEIAYKIKDSANAVRIGTLRIATNGSVVVLNDVSTETALTNFTFDAAVNGANIDIVYTSGAQTATMRADVKFIR